MEIEPVTVELACLFCDAVLKGPVDVKPKSGDLLTCPTCGQGNDYDSCLAVVKEKGVKILGEAAVLLKVKEELVEQLKKIFRK